MRIIEQGEKEKLAKPLGKWSLKKGNTKDHSFKDRFDMSSISEVKEKGYLAFRFLSISSRPKKGWEAVALEANLRLFWSTL